MKRGEVVEINWHFSDLSGAKIDPTVETASGLSKLCYASCRDILTRDQTLILRTIGVLSDSLLQQIEACLKVVLELR